MKILNTFAGIGGNRKLWQGHSITAVENDFKIAKLYKKLYPDDDIIIADGFDFIANNHSEFDFIWASPPCQDHTAMVKATRHKRTTLPSLQFYALIIFLTHFFKGKWIVENVLPYYTPLIQPATKLGRHLFWSNFAINAAPIQQPSGTINAANLAGKQMLMDWLDIHFEENIYYKGNHCPAQILRNCVPPKLGYDILQNAIEATSNS